MTTASPPGRFGQVDIVDNCITGFSEKKIGSEGMVNAGFFVLSKECLDLIEGDQQLGRENLLSAWHEIIN